MARRDETPRDLLFGLLALQNGLIDQDQLVAAFGAWSRAKGKTLAEILVERGAIDAESRALLAGDGREAAQAPRRRHREVARRRRRRPLDPREARGAGRRRPHRQRRPRRLAHARARTPRPPCPSAPPPATASGSASSGPTPRAGLGAVFVALDGELNREVALKQILDHHADDPTSRTRFLIEAEITGGLEHPGIVPVYGLGHYGDGRPYYAMRFIRGDIAQGGHRRLPRRRGA